MTKNNNDPKQLNNFLPLKKKTVKLLENVAAAKILPLVIRNTIFKHIVTLSLPIPLKEKRQDKFHYCYKLYKFLYFIIFIRLILFFLSSSASITKKT